MNIPKFLVNLDRPDGTYKPGDVISVTIRLITGDTTEFQSIFVKFQGSSALKWSEVDYVTKTCGKKKTHYKHFTASEAYFEHYENIVGSQDGPKTSLPIGEYTYHAHFRLPYRIPTDLEGTSGHIRYDITIQMLNPGAVEAKKVVKFFVAPLKDLNDYPELKVPVKDEISKTYGVCCCCTSKPLQVFNILPKRGFIPNELISFNLKVKNNSNVKVKKSDIYLIERITYISQNPYKHTKSEERKLWTHKIEEEVLPKQNKVFPVQFYLDPSKEFRCFEGSNIFNVEYFFKSEVVIKGFHSNLINISPVAIGTVPLTILSDGLPQKMVK